VKAEGRRGEGERRRRGEREIWKSEKQFFAAHEYFHGFLLVSSSPLHLLSSSPCLLFSSSPFLLLMLILFPKRMRVRYRRQK